MSQNGVLGWRHGVSSVGHRMESWGGGMECLGVGHRMEFWVGGMECLGVGHRKESLGRA